MHRIINNFARNVSVKTKNSKKCFVYNASHKLSKEWDSKRIERKEFKKYGYYLIFPETLHNGYGGIHNYENDTVVRNNDRLTGTIQAIEPGKLKAKKISMSKCKTG